VLQTAFEEAERPCRHAYTIPVESINFKAFNPFNQGDFQSTVSLGVVDLFIRGK